MENSQEMAFNIFLDSFKKNVSIFLNSSSRVRSSLRLRLSNMIGILRPRCSCSCISKNARSTPNFVPTEYGLAGVLKCEYLRLSIREDMIVYWDSIMIWLSLSKNLSRISSRMRILKSPSRFRISRSWRMGMSEPKKSNLRRRISGTTWV